MRSWKLSIWQQYVIAVAAVAVAVALKLLLDRVTDQVRTPFVLMAAGVLAAGWYGGIGPALLATGLTTILTRWLFIEPRYSMVLDQPHHAFGVVVFVIEGTFISILCQARLSALTANERARAELGERVRERTAELTRSNAVLEDQVAERRRAELDAARQREFLQALLASLREGIVAVDAAGKVTLVNRAALEMYGLPDGSVPPEEWDRYHRTFYGDGVTPMPYDERPIQRVMNEQAVTDVEKVVVTHDGRRRDLLSNGRAILDPHGERLGAVVAFFDITERRRAEEELRRHAAALQNSNRELQDFASVASHDLQEPLRKILAFGDRLRTRYEAALGPDGQDYLARMLNAAGRMSTLINDLLTFSRVTTRAQPFRQVDLSEVARDVVSDLETRVEQTGGRVEVGPLPRIDADPTQVRQLLQNLIGNALKFHRPGVPPVVRVSAEVGGPERAEPSDPDGAVCRIAVADNGIGFDEKYLDRIFAVFQRLHGRNAYEGTGIGLAVCRKIAERHHGSITARSSPDGGSTFIVTLPVRQQVAGDGEKRNGATAAAS